MKKVFTNKIMVLFALVFICIPLLFIGFPVNSQNNGTKTNLWYFNQSTPVNCINNRGILTAAGDLYTCVGGSPVKVSASGSSSLIALTITGTTGAGFVSLPIQTSVPTGVTNTVRLFSANPGSANRFGFVGQNGFAAEFASSSLTATRIFTLPDVSMTLAGISNAQTFAAAQTFSVPFASYNGDTLVGNGIPTMVALDTTHTGLTTALSATTIYTSTSAGYYEISCYLIVTTTATSGTITPSFTYVDADTSVTETVAFAASGSVGTSGATRIGTPQFCKIKAASIVQVFTTFNSVVGTPTYALYTEIKRVG